jgi:hypothetical protein
MPPPLAIPPPPCMAEDCFLKAIGLEPRAFEAWLKSQVRWDPLERQCKQVIVHKWSALVGSFISPFVDEHGNAYDGGEWGVDPVTDFVRMGFTVEYARREVAHDNWGWGYGHLAPWEWGEFHIEAIVRDLDGQ